MSQDKQLIRYKNITISGKAVSGATTLSKLLSARLGWKLLNGGELVRQFMKKNNIPLENTSLTSDQYHLNFDNFLKQKLIKEKHLVVESWLSGFDAQNIPDILKILVVCQDEEERIKRLMKRDNLSKQKAEKHLHTREAENLAKWEKLYHTRDFWNPNLYDLVIDTSQNNAEETLKLAIQKIGLKNT